MRGNYPVPMAVGLEDVFYCRARRKGLQLEKCLDDYVASNAFERRRSACYKCPRGRKNRETFAGLEGDEIALA